MKQVRLLIIGAGPTGLGAAFRSLETGEDSVLVLEAADHAGGLASSFLDKEGFTWDLGSHLQFSHYAYYDRVLEAALPDSHWNHHLRSTWVWYADRFVPYPFQLNLHHLPPRQIWECIRGMLERLSEPSLAANFADWCQSVFGTAVTDIFMRPYNEKLWACRLEDMGTSWISERVAVPKLKEVLRNLCLRTDSSAWGPNAEFRYPKRGGTGSVWKAVAALLPQHVICYNTQVSTIDPVSKVVTTHNGEQIQYESLVSTVPLPVLAKMLGSPAEMNPLSSLRSTRTHIVGVGFRGHPPESISKHCWSYYPQHEIPFYRLTVLSNLSSSCVPEAGSTWSLMAEVAELNSVSLSGKAVIEDVISALHSLGLADRAAVISRWHRRLAFLAQHGQ